MTHETRQGPSLAADAADPVVTEQITQERDIAGVLRALASGYSDRPALCRRTATGSGWEVTTYGEMGDRIERVGIALRESLGVCPGDRVTILGFTSPDYVLVDFAVSGVASAVSVPLQAGAPRESWSAIISETESRVLAVSAAQLPLVAELIAGGSLPIEEVLVFDEDRDPKTLEIVTGTGHVNVHVLSDLLVANAAPLGGDLADAGRGEAAAEDSERLALLVYTSGSTGTPKGAMYSQRAVMRLVTEGFGMQMLEHAESDGEPWVTLNFLPLSHVMGRVTLSQTLGHGGIAYFTAHSDLSELLDDLEAVRPNRLHFVPRVWELLYQEYLAQCRAGVDESEAIGRLRERCFGSQRVHALTGSAPISVEVRVFVERLIDAPLEEGYGSTEAGGILMNGRVARPVVSDYRLVDVPELGYSTADRPHPRGELVVRTDHIFGGYYRRPELTAEVFTPDGFYRTGDVMELVGPDELRYVDRRNNVIKLSNGEFVTISHVESVLSTPPIRQIYVYANSARPYLLAVVVPTPEAIADAEGDEDVLRRRLIAALREIGARGGLAAGEIPRDLLVEAVPFARTNGLLTDIGKLARPRLRDKYRSRLETLYAEADAASEQRLRRAREQASSRPVLDTVFDVVTALLDLDEGVVQSDSHFTDLGGDSLSAVTLGTALSDVLGRDVSAGTITSPAVDMAALADHLESGSGSDRPTAATVHGIDTAAEGAVLRAADLTLDKFFDARLLDGVDQLPDAPDTPSAVLITGATGFLGRYLLIDWLRRMDQHGGEVVALVRATDAAAGRQRLDSVFDSGDTELFEEFTRLADAHLRVLPGDKGAPDLGLSGDEWAELANSVDLVIDPAALVNHLLPYRELFGPNVLGTAELIRLALTGKRKPFVYISTIGVGDQIPQGEFVEDSDVRQMSPVRRSDAGYASGYSNSKWAGEVLLREAHEQCDLPVTVVRCDMILADASHVGQLNLPDMFTRLLMSIAATGLAPFSFHPIPADGTRVAAHYDALPVDFLAETISEVVEKKGFATFHAVNPHEDGVGLDTFVDWMIDFGLDITRIDDYGQWFRRFSTALDKLPEYRRRHSLLPLLTQYAAPMPASTGSVAPATQFRDAVRSLRVVPENDIPHISRAIIENYIRSFGYLNLI
ncbi:carboxylic acid reductase [Gordonia polyisoprenivorans]|uniref:carboxylic acid reductase n=1 Tax=Gordonia polyisoprenivorans TaxID=84595 RepID=UPI001AD719CC|nr:carboxylic acid reductase [Gordonia polyisoprenivorans]QTI67265.1 thioester reductase domain-containing protein [Gordonia polyisoprenivorans]